ncbi:tail assembly chaperone [Escherichia coli]|uniref:tail fiber assembly protein n=1 Tax=Escherichia coli TaxID=562 RepID=UPI00069CACA2|nr:tail assembly chaperone [Escherichia coli]EET0591742.1 tail assembly chaperone [Escherichia coli]EET0597248.1 tail assembly chaperone [Escherichia coli]EET6974303.1 tail assembly chaperone [Escherichia coli]EEW0829115.1 tail assembly chaperone [Escherichia coli]EFB5978661.1 tail assembly chaperone [Escherichia coli]
MNTYLYDAKTSLFYPLALEVSYRAAGLWPEKGVEVDESVFSEFRDPPPGKIRAADKKGRPCWAEAPAPSQAQLIAIANGTKDGLIAEANAIMNNRQWPGKAALGRLKENEIKSYSLWLDYLDALTDVDTATAPDIVWPVKPE